MIVVELVGPCHITMYDVFSLSRCHIFDYERIKFFLSHRVISPGVREDVHDATQFRRLHWLWRLWVRYCWLVPDACNAVPGWL